MCVNAYAVHIPLHPLNKKQKPIFDMFRLVKTNRITKNEPGEGIVKVSQYNQWLKRNVPQKHGENGAAVRATVAIVRPKFLSPPFGKLEYVKNYKPIHIYTHVHTHTQASVCI